MKKTSLTIALAIAAAFSLSSCAVFHPGEQASAKQDTFRFNYNTTNRAGAGVLRAFDDGQSTIVQFVDIDRQNPALFDHRGKPLTFNRIGQYAVVTGLYPWLAVKVLDETAIITNNGYKADEPTAAPRIEAAQERDALATTRAELDRTKKELDRLRAQLDAKTASVPTITKEIDAVEAKIHGIAATIVRVPFGFASTSFEPSEAVKSYLLPAAKAATSINVRGRTDSTTADPVNQRIATGRAIAARTFLIQNGVPAEKIHIYALAAGDFIADNKTEAGRAKNRRVEIVLAPQVLASK